MKTQEKKLNSVDDIECLDSSYFNLFTIYLQKFLIKNNNTQT